MKILYVSQYFTPEMGAPAARAAELARHWTEAGHGVSVLTGFPNHPTGVVPPEWRSRLRRLTYDEKVGQIDVFRTWLWALPNRKAHERMRNYLSFCISAAIRGGTIPRADVVIATSPQLLVGLSGWWLARAWRVPFVFEVRDLWPESLTAVGMGSGKSLLHRVLSAIADFLYSRADHIVVVSPAFKDFLIQHRNISPQKISVVENGVETALFTPASVRDSCALRQQLGMQGKFVACYVGTMGMAHGLETLLEAAAQLLNQLPEVAFLVIGEGSEKARIKALADSRGLSNVVFLDQQPREKIPNFISASDACLVLLKKTEIFKTVIPTKMLEFMSCARPVILGVDGQARAIMEEAGAGIVIVPENASELIAAIRQLAADPNLCYSLGGRGRDYIVNRFSRRSTAEKYIKVLESFPGLNSATRNKAAAA